MECKRFALWLPCFLHFNVIATRFGSSQPAASQPAANYTKHRALSAPKGWNTLLRGFWWQNFCFIITFPWSSRLKLQKMRLPSWELPQTKTAQHAISRICPIILHQSYGASDLKFFEHVSLNQELRYLTWVHFAYFLHRTVGAVFWKGPFYGSFRLNKWKTS